MQLRVLSRLKNLLSTNTKLHLYKYAILTVLTYCHLVWNFCTKSDRRKLERIQERALRIVFKEKTATYDELLIKESWTNHSVQPKVTRFGNTDEQSQT